MKRFKVVALLLVIVLLTTGCGKKLTCTMEESGVSAKVTMKVKKDKISDVTMEMSRVADSEEEAKEWADEAKEDNGDYKITVNGKKVTVKYSASTKDLSGEDDMSYDDAKKYFESEGFTCK